MIDDQAPTIEPDTPTPITDSPPTHPRQPSSTGPVNGHEIIAEWDSVAEGAERIIAAQTLPIEIVVTCSPTKLTSGVRWAPDDRRRPRGWRLLILVIPA